MKNLSFIKISLVFVLLVGISTGCLEDDLAFDVVESPVLAVFEEVDNGDINKITIKATFYELDKSGILDHTVGIDSMEIASLPIEIFTDGSQLLGAFTTDAAGEILFEEDLSVLGNADRLEYVGTYKEVDFRIFKNL